MKIERVEVFQARMPFKEPFRTSFGETVYGDSVIVKLQSEGITGWGEADPLFAPIYSGEMASTAYLVLQEVLLPALMGRELVTPADLMEAMAFVRGNQFAKSALEIAFWVWQAEAQRVSLHALLGGTRRSVVAGVSIGIQDSPAQLLAEIDRFLRQGYQRIKIKIKPGKDVAIARAVRQAFPAMPLMVDANSAYTLGDVAHLRQMDDLGLLMIEQPLGHDDIIDHSRLQPQLRTPICLDESIHAPSDARKAIELGSGRIINVKVGRVGGLNAAKEIHDRCQAAGWPVWAGGMMDMGIGQAVKIAFASLPNVSLPGDIEPSDRFYDEDVVDPPVALRPNGTFDVPQDAGLGYMVKEVFLREHSLRHFALPA